MTNVLAVDDSASMRAVISIVIESMGFSPIIASSGEEALTLFTSETIDIVILDVELPGINGFKVCREMRSLRNKDWFPVLYLSGTNSPDYIIEGLDAGGDAYIPKPINPRVLESILRAMGRVSDMKNALAHANYELEKLAHHDGLTQILNRRGFDEALDRHWRQAKRDNAPMALALIDIDHFKLFNDHYGHIEGDNCLKRVAKGIDDRLLRPLDIVSRYGGEEFAIILPNTPIDGAKGIAQKIVEGITQLNIPHADSPTRDVVSASLGLCMCDKASSPEELVSHADQALYSAKKNGRNQHVIW